MEGKRSHTSETGKDIMDEEKTAYREKVRKQLNDEVRKIYDVELQKASQELMEEQRNAIRQVIEEFRLTIRQVVEEEKLKIGKQAEMLKQSILKMGL